MDSITDLGVGVLTLPVHPTPTYRRPTPLHQESNIVNQHQFWLQYRTNILYHERLGLKIGRLLIVYCEVLILKYLMFFVLSNIYFLLNLGK